MCYFDAYYPWFAAGGGWQSLLSFANPPTTGGLVSYQLMQFNPYNGTAGGPLWVKASVLGNPPIILQSVSVTAGAGQGFDVLLLDTCYSVLTCEDDQQVGQPRNPQSGAVSVRVRASSVPALDAQLVGQLTYLYSPAGAVPTWQTSIPLWRDSELSAEWFTTFTASPTQETRSAPGAVFNAFAIFNASDQAQTISVTISDQSGNQIGTATTPIMPARGTAGFLLIGRVPGDALGLWPATLSLPSNSDGLFHGFLDFKGAAGGNIVAMVNRYIGNSLSNMIVAPVVGNQGTVPHP